MQFHTFVPYQKRSFRGALTNGKLTGISAKCQGDYFEENQHFIHYSFVLVNIVSVLILFEQTLHRDLSGLCFFG